MYLYVLLLPINMKKPLKGKKKRSRNWRESVSKLALGQCTGAKIFCEYSDMLLKSYGSCSYLFIVILKLQCMLYYI